MKASVYYQLGRVAQEQRQWAQAEQYYQHALQINIPRDAQRVTPPQRAVRTERS